MMWLFKRNKKKSKHLEEKKKEIKKESGLYDEDKIEEKKKIVIEGLETYDKVLRIDPQDIVAWNYKGNALLMLGVYDGDKKKIEEAVGCFDEALKINPLDVNILNNKCFALRKLGKFEDAEKCFDEAKIIIRTNPRRYDSALLGKFGDELYIYTY